jgi:hypothetical protein
MRNARDLPLGLAIVALAAALAPLHADAASLFSASVMGVSDQDPVFAGLNNGFTDSFSTAAGSGSAMASSAGAGAQLVVSASNSATYAFVCGQNACTAASASASTSDVVRITPTGLAPVGTPVSIRFDLTLDGSVVGNGGWSVQASGNAGSGTAASYANGTGGTVAAYNLAVHEAMSFDRTFLVGTDYALGTSLAIGALLRGIGPQPFGIDVDFLDTLTIQGTVLSSGLGPLQLVGDSGRDYFQAAVPEPWTGWMLFAGLGALASRRGWSRPSR